MLRFRNSKRLLRFRNCKRLLRFRKSKRLLRFRNGKNGAQVQQLQAVYRFGYWLQQCWQLQAALRSVTANKGQVWKLQ